MYKVVALSFFVMLWLTGCVPEPPKQQNNICHIFKRYPSWYWDTQESAKRWGVPISVQMAIIKQESHFNGRAKPPREHILWVIPWKRPTSAYGYSQAVDGTWRIYERETHNFGSRNAFDDATDFVGWFGNRAHREAGIPRNNAYELYLAYHEGIVNYVHGSYKHKPWLMSIAHRVQRQSWIYQQQLDRCQYQLARKPWWRRMFS